MRLEKPEGELRRGWTTGACATAATKAAIAALQTGKFPDPVTITLPKGEKPSFPLALEGMGEGYAQAGIIKDAGDDPDVTHGCLVVATVRPGGSGIRFTAGHGVGIVTREGLPVKVGEAAINPVPRQMMQGVADEMGLSNAEIEISVPGGEELASKTWNPRLGIVGGLSILGTTGIVHPFSCAAWIASIHRGVDVARAMGLRHIAGCTGSTSEAAVQALHALPLEAMIDMGDFVGGLAKYLRLHPVARLTVGGGFGKITKLAQGAMDLHSGRSQVDFEFLAGLAKDAHQPAILAANTALQVLELCGPQLAVQVAERARQVLAGMVTPATIACDIVICDRQGKVIAHAR